jgi:hypothetical protein
MMTPPQTAPQSSTALRIVGSVLLLVILSIALVNLVLPTILTIRDSFYNVQIISRSAPFIGLQNYAKLISDPSLWQAIKHFLLNSLVQIVIVSLVPLILSLAVQQQSKRVRSILNALFSLPIAFYAPVSAMLLITIGYQQFELASILSILNSLLSFGIAASLGLFWYGAIWRSNQAAIPPSQQRGPVLISWLVSVMLVLAINLQSFMGEHLFNQANSFGSLYFRHFFMFFQVGVAQALASMLICALALLGLAASILIIASGLRIFRLSSMPEARPEGSLAGTNLIRLIIAGAIFLLSLWPVLLLFADFPDGQSSSLARNLGPNILGSLLGAGFSTVIQLGLAYLAALAIGAMRPLGRQSEWLLLLFAPWLFVGVLPLLGQYFLTARELGLLNSWFALISPIALNIPLLFLFTLFFKGQAYNQSAEDGFFRRFILPSWPLVLTSAVVLLLVGWRSLVWNFILSNGPEYWNIQTAQLATSMRGGGDIAQMAIAYFLTFELPISIVAALFLIPLVLKLQGFAIRSGR